MPRRGDNNMPVYGDLIDTDRRHLWLPYEKKIKTFGEREAAVEIKKRPSPPRMG